MQRRVVEEVLSSLALPGASASECVRVLVSLGWMANAWTELECLMTKGRFSVIVPLKARLDSAEVRSIVQQAAISPIAFVDGLEKVRAARITAYAESLDRAGKRV